MNAAMYPGSFDPITLGHLDVIERAARNFDRLTVAVAASPRKKLLFDHTERIDMARHVVAHLENVEVEPFDGLLVAYAKSRGIHVLIRGLRAFSDFEYEFQMALVNRHMDPDLETVFLMTKEDCSYISSSIAKEVAGLGGDLRNFVPDYVAERLRDRLLT